MDQPLQPFSSPFALAAQAGVSGHLVGLVLFALVVLLWGIFTIVAIYHWVRYSHAALLALPSILGYLAGSGVLILFAASGLV